MNDKLSAALALARRPFVAGVFPLRINSKHEHKTGHALDRSHATKDEATICKWWTDNPNANIGYFVAPGYVIAENDPRNSGTLDLDPLAYCEHTASGPDSLHIAYELPDGLTLAGKIDIRPGVEVFGSGGNHINGAGSTINGKAYEVVNDCDAGPAPQWLVDAIVAHSMTRMAKAELREIATGTTKPDESISPERGKRWAERGLFVLTAELHDAPKGKRFDTLRRVAFKAGQLIGYLTMSVVEAQLLSACKHFEQQPKVGGALRSGLEAGAKQPRHPQPKDDMTDTRKALAGMVKMLDSASWGRAWVWGLKFEGTCKVIAAARIISAASTKAARIISAAQVLIKARALATVRGATMRAALAGIVHQAARANTFDVGMSQRYATELMRGSKGTACHTLWALQRAELLQLIDHAGREIADSKDAGKTIITGHVYRLTERGFLAIQRAEFSSVIESYTANRDGGGCDSLLPPHPLSALVDSITELTDDSQPDVFGIFGHGRLGRAAFVICRLLAVAPLTFMELLPASGLARSTVCEAIKRLVGAEMVERGARGEVMSLSTAFIEKASQQAVRFDTAKRAASLRARHVTERDARRRKVAARREHHVVGETTNEGGIIEPARPGHDCRHTPPKPARVMDVARHSQALDALDMRVEASAFWRTYNASMITSGDVPDTRVELGR